MDIVHISCLEQCLGQCLRQCCFFQLLGFMYKATTLQSVLWCILVVCHPCDGPVDTHTYVPGEGVWCSFMVDFVAPVIMRSACI